MYSSPNTSRMGKAWTTRGRDQKWTHSFHWERCLGKPRPKCKDNINKDLKEWIYLVQDKTLEPTVVNMVTNLQYISVCSFLTGLRLEVQSVWGFNLMLNTSVCLTENTHSLYYKHTPANDAASTLVQARRPSLTQRHRMKTLLIPPNQLTIFHWCTNQPLPMKSVSRGYRAREEFNCILTLSSPVVTIYATKSNIQQFYVLPT